MQNVTLVVILVAVLSISAVAQSPKWHDVAERDHIASSLDHTVAQQEQEWKLTSKTEEFHYIIRSWQSGNEIVSFTVSKKGSPEDASKSMHRNKHMSSIG